MVVSLRMKWRDPKFIIPALAVLSGVAMLAMIAGWIALLMFAPDRGKARRLLGAKVALFRSLEAIPYYGNRAGRLLASCERGPIA